MKRVGIYIAPLLLLTTVLVQAESPKFGLCEVTAFEVPADLKLPDEFRSALATNLVSRLRESGKFADVVFVSEGQSGDRQPAVRLSGNVTEFKKGSQAKRYLLGPGFGKTILKAHMKFVEVESGRVLLERDVDGKVIIGLFGGDSKGATNGVAKEIAKVAKKGL